MKSIDELLNELQELQSLLKAISWVEAKRSNLDLYSERSRVMTKREDLTHKLYKQVKGLN